jgi:cbb3-type cytochrome oxidase cytochrome c subunit
MSNSSGFSLPSHKFFETNSIFLLLGIVVAIAIGGIVEIVPLFTVETTVEHVQGTAIQFSNCCTYRGRSLTD